MTYQWGLLDRYASLSYPAGTQGTTSNAKDSTLYYAAGAGMAALAVDASQYATNQTAGASWTYEASPASRFNVTGTWAVEVDVTLDNTDTGRFFSYGTTAANSVITLRYGNTAGVVDVIMATGGVASVVGQLTLPGVSASNQRFVIAWAVEPNLYTTGATDAIRHELRAWNITAGTYAQSVFTSHDRTAGTSDFVWWANSNAGANAFTGTANACRFSATRFITATETRQDFVGLTTAPTVTGQARIEIPMPDAACALLEAGQLAGPVFACAASSVRAAGLRTLSPIVNVSFVERMTIEGDLTAVEDQFGHVAPAASYWLMAQYLYERSVPTFVDRLKCRVHVQQWRTSGATPDRLTFRVYSLNRPPNPVGEVIDADKPLVSYHSGNGVLETNHGSGPMAGQWVDLGLCPVARNSQGRTWLALAVTVTDVSGAVANTRFEIGAITIDPVVT